MKSTDKLLFGIVTGALLLVGVAFGVALTRPEPDYRSEDTPEGVVHNYLLALRQGDLQRAYGYLSPSLSGYPISVEAFAADVHDFMWNYRSDDLSTSLAVGSGLTAGIRATVQVREIRFYQRGLFDSSQDVTAFEVRLSRENGQWRIISSQSYWVWCWENQERCQ